LITDEIKSKQCHFDEHRFSASVVCIVVLDRKMQEDAQWSQQKDEAGHQAHAA
jgi:hypothetical protein